MNIKNIPLHRLKDIPVDLLSMKQLLDHAADLTVRPLKDKGNRLMDVKREIIKRWN